MPLTMLLCIQSHLEWNSSIPVMLTGVSLLYDPGINWMKPTISLNTSEYDSVKPNIVQKSSSKY